MMQSDSRTEVGGQRLEVRSQKSEVAGDWESMADPWPLAARGLSGEKKISVRKESKRGVRPLASWPSRVKMSEKVRNPAEKLR